MTNRHQTRSFIFGNLMCINEMVSTPTEPVFMEKHSTLDDTSLYAKRPEFPLRLTDIFLSVASVLEVSSTMVQLNDLKTSAGLSEVNKTLECQSYINGYWPTSVDADFFRQISAPSDQYPHLQRWYRHMESFTEAEKSKWEKCSIAEQKNTKKAEDDDVDLFGDSSDEEMDEEKERIKQQRLQAYEMKKAKKPAAVAKSNIILDIKPWDDETDLAEMERQIREINTDGLLWGASKVIPVAYGIKKVQISCVVEDDKVGTDFLEDKITAIEDLVQSVDIVAFNKI
uniref:Translation elongation factor EF1B beta/delta subunit guanine nucleotide exchange domain-containing protein n=1 Tax=Trichuris muris TaxID=70415 RepID=A0A5S6QGR4_TRIMR